MEKPQTTAEPIYESVEEGLSPYLERIRGARKILCLMIKVDQLGILKYDMTKRIFWKFSIVDELLKEMGRFEPS